VINANFPEKLAMLFEPARYKILHGGRGASKSWGAARALLIKGSQKALRILCARETQRSIEDSVHKLLSDQILELGLGGPGGFYAVQQTSITGKNGTEFIFAGLRQNINNLKSYESVDICWVEEAHTVSKNSWEVLIPTIRKDGSEIWVTFNPELDTDDTWKRFVLNPPPGAKVVRMTYADNPWFPRVLRDEMEHLKATDPDAYMHVWEGHTRQMLQGAIYANELRAAQQEGRICKVPYDRTRPVYTFWDLGFGDSTAIWFVQAFPFEYRLIDYESGCQLPLAYYLKAIQSRQYIYGGHYLPHDGKSKALGTGKSILDMMIASGFKTHIVPSLSLTDGINAARTIFAQCWFDEENTADGLQGLRHYQWAPEGTNGVQKREPLHNWASHPGDAFRYFAVGIRLPKAAPPKTPRRPQYVSAWS
jgi:phage terminase large subunit